MRPNVQMLLTTFIGIAAFAGILRSDEPAVSAFRPKQSASVPAAIDPESMPFIAVSATVYDHELTELKWTENGIQYRAFSNIDFNYFSGPGQITVAENVTYHYVMGLGNQSTEGLEEQLDLPALESFPEGRSAYAIVGAQPSGQDKMPAILDEFHRYYDAHAEELIAAAEARDQARIAHEEYLTLNPPPSPDAPLSFWLEKSRQYLQALREGLISQ